MLDRDAQAVVDAVEPLVVPRPMHVQGVEETRRRIAALPAAPSYPPVHSVEDRGVPGPAGEVPVRIYRPSSALDLPVLVWLHGGAFCLGDLDTSDTTARTLAVSAQCVVVSVDYRLAPEHKFPAAFEDAAAAYDWAASNVDELGADGTRLAVGGESAGAAIAASLAVHLRDHGGPAPALQILVYGSTAYPTGDTASFRRFAAGGPLLSSPDVTWGLDHYLRDERDRSDPRANAGAAATLSGLARAVVVSADHDPLLDDVAAYAERLAADRVPVTYRAYTGVFHGFFGMPGALAKATQANRDVAGDLRDVFERPPTPEERTST